MKEFNKELVLVLAEDIWKHTNCLNHLQKEQEILEDKLEHFNGEMSLELLKSFLEDVKDEKKETYIVRNKLDEMLTDYLMGFKEVII